MARPFSSPLLTFIAVVAVFSATPLYSENEYSNFPSETAVVKTENGKRILHQDDFSTNTLHRLWGTASDSTVIEDGVIKVNSQGGPSGKLKVSVEAFKDCQLAFRFRFQDSQTLVFGFDDLTAKDIVHGGHILGIRFGADGIIQIKDNLSGAYNTKYYQQFKEKKLTPELKALFARCEKQADYPFTSERWYDALIELKQDTVTISIDDENIIAFQSPGFAHPRKDMYRFLIGKGCLQIDDVSLIEIE